MSVMWYVRFGDGEVEMVGDEVRDMLLWPESILMTSMSSRFAL
jgi:hypothetical protein